jgi:hypothetical protein
MLQWHTTKFLSVLLLLLLAAGEAVMMGWEGPLMVHHAAEICAAGGDILNVGFGLGLIDEEIQVGHRKVPTYSCKC